jgi:general stress protein 26
LVEQARDEFPLEDRTFVCLGLHKETGMPHSWVMTFDQRCEVITLWETTTNETWELRGRVEERDQLKTFLRAKGSDCAQANSIS